MNRADLKAWKAYDTQQYSLIPGLNNGYRAVNVARKSIDATASTKNDSDKVLNSPYLDVRKANALNQSMDFRSVERSAQISPKED